MRNTLKALILVVALIPGFAFATITGSAHDLSTYSGNTSHELCGFCHTPHSASTGQTALWNRSMPTTQYTWSQGATANGTLLNTQTNHQPGVASLKCLSCHDGTMAYGTVINSGNSLNPTSLGVISTMSTSSYKVTRGASNDLTGNHPVGVPYPQAGVTGSYNGIASNPTGLASGFKAAPTNGIRLYFAPGATTGVQGIECGSCHDPHGLTAAGVDVPHFLRMSNASSALCISCHSK